ncbi:MAG: hypothetical protein FI729_01395 [SAR202 cluster bacterium]|nr:hypothetical protein [SAR202 cluster bacterium]|tara:strand:- start:1312 stop:2649 length:1338 start_codon:yes stop_codon:yes gene_type:complete
MDSITLQTRDNAIASGDVIGRLGFAASSESDGTNATLVAAKIETKAEKTFSASDNAASMVFYLANDGAAASKMTLSPAGNLTVAGDLQAANGTLSGLTVDSTGGIKVKNGDTSAGFIEFYEDSDNGTNKVTLIGRTSTGSDLTVSLPAYTGTLVCSAGTHTITASAASDTPLINKGESGQSASLQEWQNNIATKLLAVGPDGGLELPDNTPDTTTNKLYNDGGTLKFNGSAVGGGGGVDAANGVDNRIATFTDSDSLNGEANLTFDGSALTCIGTMTVGVDDTGHDVKFFGARSGSYVEWDESENRLHLVQGAYVNQPVPATGSTTENATLEIDLSKGNYFNILLGDDITAVEFQNATVGQKFIIRFIQATSGTGWGISWSTVRIDGSTDAELKWAGNIAPTMTGNDGTSHEGHKDVYGFLCTATGGSDNDTKFDGFIIGQDIPN